MSRRRQKNTPLPVTILLSAVALAVSGWGVIQAYNFWQALQAEQKRQDAAEAVDSTLSTQPQSVDFEPVQEAVLLPDPEFASLPPPQLPLDPASPPATIPADLDERVAFLLAQAEDAFQANRIVDARTALNSALALLPTASTKAANLRDQLSALNRTVFFGTDIFPEDPLSHIVAVEQGDTFQKIAKKNLIPAALLAKINPDLRSTNLKLNSGIKVITGPFHLRILKAEARADLFLRDLYIASYPLFLEEGSALPRGLYQVQPESKIQVGNKLWIGFEPRDSTSEIVPGWLYGSAGPRRGSVRNDLQTGAKFADEDLAQLYNALVEKHSLIRVDP